MEARELYHKTLCRRQVQEVYLFMELEKSSRKTDEFTRKVHSMCFFSQKAVKSYFVFCLPTTLHWSFFFLLVFFFFFSIFLLFWLWLNIRAQQCRFTLTHCLQREGGAPSDMANSHHFLPGPPARSAPQQQQQQDGLKCKECASVHKQYLSL